MTDLKNTTRDEYGFDPKINVRLVDGHIYFFDDVTPESQLMLETLIRQAISDKLIQSTISGNAPTPVVIQINSRGGDGFAGAALYDFISSNNAVVPIETVIDGMCASAASLIFLAGKYRCMTATSILMIHEGSFSTYGKTTEVIDHTTMVEKLNWKIAEIYASELKLDLKDGEEPMSKERVSRIREFIRRDRSFNFEETVDIGGIINEPEYPRLNEKHQKAIVELSKKFLKEELEEVKKEQAKAEKTSKKPAKKPVKKLFKKSSDVPEPPKEEIAQTEEKS